METAERFSLNKLEALLFLGFSIFGFLLILFTQHHYGMVWDEGYYYPTFVSAKQWFILLFSDPKFAISSEGINAYWSSINELPPVTKYLGALSVALTPGDQHLIGMRIYSMVLFGLSGGLIFLCSLHLYRKDQSIKTLIICSLPTVLYFLHPRIYAHGHFAVTETVFAFLTILVMTVIICMPRSILKIIVIAILLALSVATKVNGLILLVSVLFYYLIITLHAIVLKIEFQKPTKNESLTMALSLIGALFLIWVIWPWMWYDTSDRIHEYWRFIRDHSHLGVWYLGDHYNDSIDHLAPWHYPIVMTFVASPVFFLISAFAGIFTLVISYFKNSREYNIHFLLLLILGSSPLAAMILTGAPKYDGLRLFLPIFAPIALCAPAFLMILNSSKIHLIAVSVMVFVFLEFLPNTKNALNYYNLPTTLITEDGFDFPFESSYWMESLTAEEYRKMAEIVPGDEPIRIKTRAIHNVVIEIQSEWGTIPEFIVDPEPPYDLHLIQTRRGYWTDIDWYLVGTRENLVIDPVSPDAPRFFVLSGDLPQ